MGRVTDPYKYNLTYQAYNESYSKVIRGHKYKDKENEKRQKHRHLLNFGNPDDSLIPNMMIDTSP